MDKPIRIAAFGDIVGEVGTTFFTKRIEAFRRENRIDCVIVNGENCAKGNGIDPESARMLRNYGADAITSGNHVYKKREIKSFLDDCDYLIRPANYPDCAPGMGYTFCKAAGCTVLVINVMGCVYLDSFASPFETVERILKKESGKYDISVLDVHAEATSEKAAIARYFDGKLDIVFGTHTHVQTSDARILPQKTGFITDLGMCGPRESILGVQSEKVIERFLTKMPVYFETAGGPCQLEGAVFTVIPKLGCTDVKSFRINE